MDSVKIQRFYLRALYTEILLSSDTLDDESAFVLRTISTERLNIERAARIRNLRTVLHGDMQILNKAITSSALLSHVQAYARSPSFWMHRGRAQIEDFCLFFCESPDIDAATKLCARIEGVFSGLSASANAATPWSGHVVSRSGANVVESFAAPFSLSWRGMLEDQRINTVMPSTTEVTCQVKRIDNKIRIGFVKGSQCKQ